MRKLLFLGVAAALAACDWQALAAAQSKKKSPPAKTTANKSVSTAKKSTTAAKSPAAQKKTASSAKKTTNQASAKRSAKKAPARKVTWRNRQTTPSQERYKEIQDALAAKGYLKLEQADGTWGADSSEALKKFQVDQNIEASGKINSLSLIALGWDRSAKCRPRRLRANPPSSIASLVRHSE